MRFIIRAGQRFDLVASSPLGRGVVTWLGCLLMTFVVGCRTAEDRRHSSLWDLGSLSKTPAVTWGSTNGLVQAVYYEGEPLNGKATRIFAFLGRPATPATGTL